MKPLFLEIQAFGPYVEKQTIDFEKLSEKGIFLIKGKTGSGKTTVFDAMTFALYGGGSGEDEKSKSGRNDLEEWRCTQADDNTDTFVSFTFSVHGRKYKFARKLVKKRVNLSAEYEAGEIDEEGNVIPFFENPKKDSLTKKAEELVGLTKEQFRQVVLLPQGQFERFLTASSSDKEAILQKIFDSGKWKKYAEVFYKEAQTKKDALTTLKTEIMNSLSEENVESLEELENLVCSIEEELKKTKTEHENFNGEEKQKQLTADIALFEQFKPLHELLNAKKKLDGISDEIKQKKVAYEKAEKAELLRKPVEEYEKAEVENIRREKELWSLKKNLPAVEKKVMDAEEKYKQYEADSPVEMLNKKLGEYNAKKADYESIDELRNQFNKSVKSFTDAEKEYTKASAEFDKTKKKAAEFFEKLSDCEAKAKNFRERYFSGIYGEIAETLSDGKKCPVCGSVHHPEPAEKTPESVSKDDVDKKEQQTENVRKEWKDADGKREKCESLKNEKEKALEAVKGEKATAEKLLESAKEKLIEGIADYNALIEEENKIRKKISDFVAESEALKEKAQLSEKELNELKSQIRSAEKEAEASNKILVSANKELCLSLEKAGYCDAETVKNLLVSSEERSRMHTEIVEYDKSCRDNKVEIERKKEELKGKTEPNSSNFESRQKEITEENRQFVSQSTRLNGSIEHLNKKLKILTDKNEQYKNNILQAEEDLAFAKKLRGDTGIGIQRYVLAIMFNQVITEANRMLEKVHGGRYRLFRTDDKESGNKRGLELKVHDNRSPEKNGRSVAMLSGGEKFLVSLALSIGMSTIAQKSGVQIEALFIDEGFGTLDDSSIQDAMKVLDSVRKSSGMIGIISHVALLEANIPTHLEIVKNDTGSTISIR